MAFDKAAYMVAYRQRPEVRERRFSAEGRARNAAAQSRYHRKQKGKLHYRTRQNVRLYGLAVDDFDRMVIEQCGRCAICEQPMEKPAIDHDHKTGKVRGLLCGPCNLALGVVEDRLHAVAEYLCYHQRRHRPE